ncbi:MAG: hypothetical protein KH369_15885 [Paraclostridium bifermentans]|uniref:DUF6906 family protein n=1 Tax=Paraclostridium bifermentans TaxID=1490 RepID=UPI001DFD38B4|nr:hypothetical protein [Paraclostridium bifermentans]MBS6509682.1 hypothetical protein [Paraclostridium bifermentans]
MKKLKKLNRRQKNLLAANGFDYMDYFLERQDYNSFTFVHKESKESLQLRFK